MSVIDQLTTSNFSLDGPSNLSNRNFGYTPNGNLHDTYSVNSLPKESLIDFNGIYSPGVPPESTLDELDPIAPSNTSLGFIPYKSNNTYQNNPPAGGHF